jgi:hypothetical protein
MAVETQPLEVDDVHNEQRFFGGDPAWWLLLLLVSVPVMLYGLSQAPQISGFVFLSIGGILAGIAFTQLMMRLPYVTRRFAMSLLIVVVVSAVIGGIAMAYSATLPVPSARPDTMYKPPISGG